MNEKLEKNVESMDNKAITETIVPIYLHLQLSLRKMLLFMYFIYDVMYFSINNLLNIKHYQFFKKLNDINKKNLIK